MSHTALARKYRPKRFADLVAQQHVAAGLLGAVVKNRVAHGYLLTGPRGVGKTTAARILAMALNCADRGTTGEAAGEPCGVCDSCGRIWTGAANLDVVEIDAATNRGVDDARELRERAMYAPSAPDRFKIYIIDEAHMLTREAWNALLKILEEPPPRVVFVFATTEPLKIANTAAPVLSRLQRFDFRRIGSSAIIDRLRHVVAEEHLQAEDDALLLIAKAAQGGMRDALSLLDQALAFGDDQVTAERVRVALGLVSDELYAELLDIVAEHRSVDVFPFVRRVVEAGGDLAELVGGLGEVLRALLLKVFGDDPQDLTEDLREAIARHAESFTEGDLLRMLKLLAQSEQAVRRSPNARIHVETLLLEWTLLDRTVELQEVIAALQGDERGTPRVELPKPRASARASSPSPDTPRRSASSPSRSPEAPRSAPPASPRAGASAEPPLTLESLKASWSSVLEQAGSERRMVREALTHATPASVRDGMVTLTVSDSSVHLEGLERHKAFIADTISHVVGTTVLVAYESVSAPDARAVPAEAERLDRNKDREARLKHYRQKDPALDAVAEALDLELLE